jgi:hypothetical protein
MRIFVIKSLIICLFDEFICVKKKLSYFMELFRFLISILLNSVIYFGLSSLLQSIIYHLILVSIIKFMLFIDIPNFINNIFTSHQKAFFLTYSISYAIFFYYLFLNYLTNINLLYFFLFSLMLFLIYLFICLINVDF